MCTFSLNLKLSIFGKIIYRINTHVLYILFLNASVFRYLSICFMLDEKSSSFPKSAENFTCDL